MKTATKSVIRVPVVKKDLGEVTPLDYEITGDKKINLTKEKAYEFLELKTFQGERAIRDRHVQFLYEEALSGRFLWHQVIIAIGVMDKDRYRLNGQHTCWMRVNVPDSVNFQHCEVREITYQVDDGEQLRALYSAFDRHAPRTAGHVSVVQLMDTDAARGIPQGYIKNIVSGFKHWVGNPWAGGSHPGSDIGTTQMITMIQKEYPALFNVVGHFFRDHYEEMHQIRRSAVMGAIFATFNKSVKAGEEFWRPVVDGINLEKKTDPRYKLREFILTHSHTLTRSGAERVSAEELYRISINAWNTWRSGDDLHHMKRPSVDAKRPQPK